MRRARRYLPLLVVAALAGAAVGIIPSIANGSASGTVTARDFYFQGGDGSDPAAIAITPGGTVSFSNGGIYQHDVQFTGPLPASCTDSAAAGHIVGPTQAAPGQTETPTGAPWTGSCTFSTPGVYTFECNLHFFTGTIYVNAAGTVSSTTTTTTTTTSTGTTSAAITTTTTLAATTIAPATTTSQPGSTTPTTPTTAPQAGPAIASGSVALPAVQHGRNVSGSLTIAPGGARLLIGLLFSANQARVSQLNAGTLSKREPAGRVRLLVKLNRAGKRALARHGKLRLTVRISATSLASHTTTAATTTTTLTRRVTLTP